LTTGTAIQLKRTALYAVHKAAGGRMVEFAGWEMPVEYSGIVSEHLAVRTAAGLFDVSHMGEIEIRGPEAEALLQWVTSNDAARLKDSQAQYTALMQPQGSAVDDCVLHRLGEGHYLLCVNAANTDKDFAWIARHNRFNAEVRDVSDLYSQLAIQGPRAASILSRVAVPDPRSLATYWFRRARCLGVDGIIARTGYTGEDGFEFYFPPEDSDRVWNGLLDAGKQEGLVPAGLGARNTLRLEAGYALYGHELDDDTTLLEANLGWISKLEKGEFLGRDALLEEKREGLRKKLVGFEMLDRAIARDNYDVWAGGEKVGRVTSGSPAPYLKKNIGLAFVPPAVAGPGRELEIEIRGKHWPARQVGLPFYKRPKA
jgi:glycine cleavage system T protein (aminomethyltransferase)